MKGQMNMHTVYPRSKLDDITVFELPRFEDDRGVFSEVYHTIKNDLGITFVQDNFSISKKNVLRGLHIQRKKPQGKLVTCVKGSVLDVAIDLRSMSANFGKVYTFILTGNKQVYIPAGFAHGFLSQEDDSCVYYKCTKSYDPDSEVTINPFDEELGVDWGINKDECIVSEKDANGISLKEYLS